MDSIRHENTLLLDMANMYHDKAAHFDSLRIEALKQAKSSYTITQYTKLHDTFNMRFTDTFYCKSLEVENQDLWNVVKDDSGAINYLDSQIEVQTVLIRNDSAYLERINKLYLSEQGRANKAQKLADSRKGRFWQGMGLGAIFLEIINLVK